jgi:hypothetical protein
VTVTYTTTSASVLNASVDVASSVELVLRADVGLEVDTTSLEKVDVGMTAIVAKY